MPVATSCNVRPGVCWIARIGQTKRPKSARLPVTKQIFRGELVIVGPDAGAARQVDQPSLDRFRDAEIAARTGGKHGKLMHQGPRRTGAETCIVERGQDVV